MSEDALTQSEKEENYSNSSAEEIETPTPIPTDSAYEEKKNMTDYEKQRLSRIRENQARLQALGLSKMATSLMGLRQNESKKTNQRKGKAKMAEDEEYRPPVGEDEGSSSSSAGDDDDDDEFVGNETPGPSRKKMKYKKSKSRKKVSIQKILNNSNVIGDDDDEALNQAIALSLKETAGISNNSVRSSHNSNDAVKLNRNNERKGNARKEDSGNRKRKKPISSRVQMTEDEVILHFFQFDEAGKDVISRRDLQRIAMDHDFTWTDKEMADMINCFDSDGDGMLNLDDFWKIVGRCNMIHRV